MITLSPERLEKFWSFVDKTEGCWLWSAGTCSRGYGNFKVKNKTLAAHRVSYLIHFGSVPSGLQVLHKCDTPACVRPDHLFVGTGADNMADKVAKGRQARGESVTRNRRSLVGSRNGRAILTAEVVQQIKDSWSFRKITQKDLARKFGISLATVSRILRGVSWQE